MSEPAKPIAHGATPRIDPRDLRARSWAGWLSLTVGLAIFLAKLLAWWWTGSTAVLSDAMESIVNVVAAALLVYTLHLSAQPADRDHPYGHGKVEFFSAGAEGTLIAIAATLVFVEAGRQLLRGKQLQQLGAGMLLVGGAGLVHVGLGLYLIRVGRRTHSLALVADGRHALTDVATSAGVIGGLAAVRLSGWVVLDPLIAMVIAANILRTGWKLVREAVGGLMDEADLELIRQLVAALESHREPGWIDVHTLRAWRSGAVQHADLHLVVPRYFDADQLHRIHERVEQVLGQATGLPGDAIVHFDPCRPRHCRSCAMEACPVREAPFAGREPITLERAVRGDEALDTGEPVSSRALA